MSVKLIDDWTGKWVAARLGDEPNVLSCEQKTSNSFVVIREELPPVTVVTMSNGVIDKAGLEGLISHAGGKIEFLCIVKKDFKIESAAMLLADETPFGIGGVGELKSALRMESPETYLGGDAAFIKKGLRQHDKVVCATRLDLRTYEIERVGALSTLVVVAINDYDITAEAVRDAFENRRQIDIILKSNPNGNISDGAHTVAEGLGAKVLRWGEFLGALNK